MDIAEKDRDNVLAKLQAANEQGENWVAYIFSGKDAGNPEWLRFFESAEDAEGFCAHQSDFHYIQGEFFEADRYWRYAAIETLQKQLAVIDNETFLNPVDIDLARQQVAAAGIGRVSGDEPDFIRTLVGGSVVQVRWEEQIIPSDRIDRYHVIGHQWPSGQIYEVGHSVKVFGSYERLEDAEKNMLDTSERDAVSSRTEYKVVGQYHDKPFKLDMEGDLHSFCGITVLRTGISVTDELYRRDLSRPAVIDATLFARYDADAAHLQLLDYRLQPANPHTEMYDIAPFHFDDGASFKKQQSITIMEQQMENAQAATTTENNNLEKLKENLKYRGFDTIFDKILQEKLEDKVPEFTLQHSTDQVIYDLYFNKSKDEDKWYFNKMDATLLPTEHRPEGYMHTFYENQGITAKEAVNLLEGRAVFKKLNIYEKENDAPDAKYKWTDQTYNAWLQIDFSSGRKENNQYELKRYSEFKKKQNSNDPDELRFDLKQVLLANGIRDADNPLRSQQLLQSLGKGNLAKTTRTLNGKEETVYVLADAMYKNIMLFDQNKKRLFVSKKESAQQSETGEQAGSTLMQQSVESAKPETGKSAKKTDDENPAKEKNRRKGHSKGM
ncbi:hypothetical protein MUY27_00265 [Mucilaginibacter sp. RS28]|uniref:Uncharacterized protein n=1 Tax=Mucilaginibacter straminoryzae TaxID=2932774 RepID=A0A9X1WZ61_9SPHI|nr:hypothetical protein [Mucilaginibacter straminoryzae]MCJ8208118.1 hypothetical protein [Mucilaginibacter straminoryzae]